MKRALILSALLCLGAPAAAEREPVLKQVDLPHSYYWRELYLPQLTTGPSAASFMPDGKTLIYSMGGSLWRQAIGSNQAVELTHPTRAYDYQPDVSADGKTAIFSSYDGDGIELWRLDLATGAERQLTFDHAVNVEPRLSPDGKRIAWVSTKGTGHFNLFVAEVAGSQLRNARPLLGERQSKIARYYYSTYDHAINPSWTPDGKRILYVTNNEVAWGTGDIWSVAVDNPSDRRKVLSEETSWSGRPETSPDGKRILFASYHGRQWRQLWVTTPDGMAPLPLSFGDFDRWNARWSPDGRRVALISNEHGNTSLVVRDVVGGAETPIIAAKRRYLSPRTPLRIDIVDENGRPTPARVAIIGSDGRAAAPDGAWMAADDGFDRTLQRAETHYFDCPSRCSLDLPTGDADVWVQHGMRYLPFRRKVSVRDGQPGSLTVKLVPNDLPPSFGKFVSADLHVHMNYGGHYRATPETLAAQARAEDLNVVYNLLVNKEERVPDIAYFRTGADPVSGNGLLLLHSQEYHTSYWGHLGLLGLSDHYLAPGFSAYQNSPLASAYPDNGAIADLAHAQGALVGYVHPFDTVPDPVNDKSLTNELPADVAHGKVDYMEIVGFSDHKATAEVWYRLLNLGFRIPAGAGTDAMTNYADLRGPVGMNRVFLDTGGALTPATVRSALKAGRTFATNGPLLGLEIDGKHPGDTIERNAPAKLHYRIALRSFVPVDHLDLVQNGRVVKSFIIAANRQRFNAEGEIDASSDGWVVLRAWNDGSSPLVLDIYPYATTSPIYLDLPAGPPPDRQSAAYFVAWLDRTIADAASRTDYRTEAERDGILKYLREARARYAAASASGQ
jgi:TolB protein